MKEKLHDKFIALCSVYVEEMKKCETVKEQLSVVKELKEKLERLYYQYLISLGLLEW